MCMELFFSGNTEFVCPTCGKQFETQEEFDNRWDTIFGKKEKKPRQEEFELESLDPDERSWYYDDHGIKRRKEKEEIKIKATIPEIKIKGSV